MLQALLMHRLLGAQIAEYGLFLLSWIISAFSNSESSLVPHSW